MILGFGLHDIILFLAAFVSELLGVVSGFGSSTFFIPLALQFESFQFAITITALLHCMSNTSKIFYFKQGIAYKMVIKFALIFILSSALGAFLNRFIAVQFLKEILGIFLVCYALFQLLKKEKMKIKSTHLIGFFFIFLSGLLTGLVGTGGALRAIGLSAFQLSPSAFIFTSALIDLGGDLVRAIIYLSQGYMDWSQWYYIPFLLISAWLGTWIGKKIVLKMNPELFKKIVSFFVLLSGLGLIFQ